MSEAMRVEFVCVGVHVHVRVRVGVGVSASRGLQKQIIVSNTFLICPYNV